MNGIGYFLEYNRYLNIIGVVAIFLIAFIFSRKRCAIAYKKVGIAFLAQIMIALLVLKTGIGRAVVQAVATGVTNIYQLADTGSSFIFGKLIDPSGSWGFIFAFKVLPIIVFFSALTSILFYFGIIQFIIGGINYVMQPLFGTSGAETLVAIANSFLGQTEAPLLIRNYVPGLTKSEMLTVMISGMATISGAVLVVYAAVGIPVEHLLASSVMAIPSALLISKILYPETDAPLTKGAVKATFQSNSTNFFDAVASGTLDGLTLALAIGAMLMAFVALVGLINCMLLWLSTSYNSLTSWFGMSWHLPNISLNLIFSYICYPITYLLGLTGSDAVAAGDLLGTKISINEMVAYTQLSAMHLSSRTVMLLTYALCGFANFSSIGIQIAGIGALAPEKRSWISELGLIAVLGGTLSNLLSAMIVGFIM